MNQVNRGRRRKRKRRRRRKTDPHLSNFFAE